MKWREKAGLAHLGLSTHASISMWTLGDAFQFGDRPQVAFWVDPRTRNCDVDSGMENSVSFFFTETWKPSLAYLSFKKLSWPGAGNITVMSIILHIGAYAISGRFRVTRARLVLATHFCMMRKGTMVYEYMPLQTHEATYRDHATDPRDFRCI